MTNPRPPREVQPRSSDLAERLDVIGGLIERCPDVSRPHVSARLDALERLLGQIVTNDESSTA